MTRRLVLLSLFLFPHLSYSDLRQDDETVIQAPENDDRPAQHERRYKLGDMPQNDLDDPMRPHGWRAHTAQMFSIAAAMLLFWTGWDGRLVISAENSRVELDASGTSAR
jgi:hypothetical protein